MKKPVVLVVMDGVGETPEELGNMVKKATTPTLNELKETCPWQIIKAHGTAVGLPSDDDMGNSEVGHNALGCGQIYSQGAKLVNESIESGKIYTSDAWKNLVSDLKDNGATLHFIGLLSDGNVHSNISHLIAMLKEAKKEGVKRVRCHILLDGRDVPATSALEYVQEHLRILSGFYGVLRPFDGVRPYRLEMQAKLKTDFCASMYDFWGEDLARLLDGEGVLLNLASAEYSRSVLPHLPPGIRVITPIFGERNGAERVVEKGVYVKMARGEMVRFLAEQGTDKPDALTEFDRLGFRCYSELSTPERPVFLRT